MQIEKNSFGLNIRGVDCNAATAAEVEQLKDLMYRKRLIVLKDQMLSEQEYCDFANRFVKFRRPCKPNGRVRCYDLDDGLVGRRPTFRSQIAYITLD